MELASIIRETETETEKRNETITSTKEFEPTSSHSPPRFSRS
jgi:hypothetical protein